ncbi:cysteine-rich repeat secretory protein 55-like [Cryptomeria japonica]|uniref:cysteine-rich repeat secretory protein 55-like n=1 Tax=Cryptomeria japonica TaxID=3369 RepID=UPI0027DA1EDB|nr:cysteine-rich repeat secretory protein 55-like [Cryptomeria japonica]
MKCNSFPFIPQRASIFLQSLVLFLFVMNFPSVICTYLWHTCDNSSTFRKGSTYPTNLNLVINDLFRNAPKSSGFNTSSHGQSPNKVYGLVQCTGNISPLKCSKCVVEANSSIQEGCANDIGGRIWLGDCFLRYQSSNFISTLDTNGPILVNVNSITGEVFKSTTGRLLSNLSNKAYIPANKGFAAGSANYSASGMLYGSVQCWRDISTKDCRKCLDAATTTLNECCSTNQGAQFLGGSCKVRYETYSFF